ncbi:MAG: hypothetical protein R2776_08875 [Flavobacteriaceae bacterium]
MKTIEDFDFKNSAIIREILMFYPLSKLPTQLELKRAKPTILKTLEDGGSCVLMFTWEGLRTKKRVFIKAYRKQPLKF